MTLTSVRAGLQACSAWKFASESIGSRAITIRAQSSTRSDRMVDDPEDVLTDRNVRPNKETPEERRPLMYVFR